MQCDNAIYQLMCLNPAQWFKPATFVNTSIYQFMEIFTSKSR